MDASTIITPAITAIFTVTLGIITFEYQQRWQAKIKYYELIIKELELMNEAAIELIESIELEFYSSLGEINTMEENIHKFNEEKSSYKFTSHLENIKSFMPILKIYISKESTSKIHKFISDTKNSFQNRKAQVEKNITLEEEKYIGGCCSYEAYLYEELKILKKLTNDRLRIYEILEKEIDYLHLKIIKYLRLKCIKIKSKLIK